MNCPTCDLPMATADDYARTRPGEGSHLCWANFGERCHPHDWRGEAMRSREAMRVAREALESVRESMGVIDRAMPEKSLARACFEGAFIGVRVQVGDAIAALEKAIEGEG